MWECLRLSLGILWISSMEKYQVNKLLAFVLLMWSMKIYLFIDWTTFGLLWSHLGAVPRSRLWVNAVHKNQFSLCTGRVFKRAFKVNVQLQFRPTFVRCSRQFWVNATFKNQFFLCTVCPLECAFKVNVQLKPSFIFCSIQFWSRGWLGVEEITSTIQFFLAKEFNRCIHKYDRPNPCDWSGNLVQCRMKITVYNIIWTL